MNFIFFFKYDVSFVSKRRSSPWCSSNTIFWDIVENNLLWAGSSNSTSLHHPIVRFSVRTCSKQPLRNEISSYNSELYQTTAWMQIKTCVMGEVNRCELKSASIKVKPKPVYQWHLCRHRAQNRYRLFKVTAISLFITRTVQQPHAYYNK